jgi:hypothetical protein
MIAFGPIPSRRLGRSLGINNIPPKTCTYRPPDAGGCGGCVPGTGRGRVAHGTPIDRAGPARRNGVRGPEVLWKKGQPVARFSSGLWLLSWS